jgi:hypothetical protein
MRDSERQLIVILLLYEESPKLPAWSLVVLYLRSWLNSSNHQYVDLREHPTANLNWILVKAGCEIFT